MTRSKRDEWARRVRAWKASGQSCREFAAEAGVNPSTLAWWNWKLRTAVDGEVDSVVRFVELDSGAISVSDAGGMETTEGTGLELRAGAYTIGIPPGFDGATLARVLGVLEACR